MQTYLPEIEKVMQDICTLNEKDRRRLRSSGSVKLGHGGQSYIAKVLDAVKRRLAVGVKEFEQLPDGPVFEPGIRKVGGGRKGYMTHHVDIDAQFLDVVERSHRR